MAIIVVRLGEPRSKNEGARLGTVRRPPRGVPKKDFARRDFYDVWVPDLAPSAQLLSWATSEPWTGRRWTRFVREYKKEMKDPASQRLISLLAALSRDANFSVGCYCVDRTQCHRAVLEKLLGDAGAVMAEVV